MARAGASAFDLTGRAYSDSLAQTFIRLLLWHLIASSNIKAVIYGICRVRSTPCVQFLPKNEKKRLSGKITAIQPIFPVLGRFGPDRPDRLPRPPRGTEGLDRFGPCVWLGGLLLIEAPRYYLDLPIIWARSVRSYAWRTFCLIVRPWPGPLTIR